MKFKSIVLSMLLVFSSLSLVAMHGPTHYDILGVSPNATQDEISRAFRKKQLHYHPDKFANKSAEEKAEAERYSVLINNAHNVLKDVQEKQKYDRFIGQQPGAQENTYFTETNTTTTTQDHFALLAGMIGVRTTYSYLSTAWQQYTMHNNFLAIKKHVELQLKNKQANKPVKGIRDTLDLSWLNNSRQRPQLAPIEQIINQFDLVVVQRPDMLPTVCPKIIEMVDTCKDIIGNGKTNFLKALMVAGLGTIGYITSDKWLPQVLESKLFRFCYFMYRTLG